PSSITMTPGESDTLDHYWRYESTYGVSWSSSDTSVAKVDANGKITAVAPGEAVVTLKSKNSSINMKATCKVTVTGTGSGQVTRIAGATRYETALKLAEYEGYDSWRDSNGKFSAVVIACGSNYPDALGGSYLAVKSKAPIILTDSSRVDEAIDFLKDNLASGGTVYILGGTGALPSSLESGISNLGIGASPVRLGGKTRYDTSMMILEEAGVSDGQDILIATGKNYADSLSASSSGRPIMLVGDSLTQEQKTFLSNHPSSHVYLLGGSASVSKTVESQVKACCGGVSPSRLAGKSRYETSVAIAEEFFPSATQAVVSYARNFPDGLAAGPLANNIGAPVILTDSSNSSVASSYANSGSIGSGIVTGGASIIPDGAVYKIFNVKSITRI
ncbi:MAG: cell wall-binding repeat-containing protein, partial [Coriobacteriales bacterium]